jgi:hypothetical protein
MDRSKTKIDVKLALAAKYERLANLANSSSKRTALAYQALKFRRQAAQLQQEAK